MPVPNTIVPEAVPGGGALDRAVLDGVATGVRDEADRRRRSRGARVVDRQRVPAAVETVDDDAPAPFKSIRTPAMPPEIVRDAPPAGAIVTAVYDEPPVPFAFRTALAPPSCRRRRRW